MLGKKEKDQEYEYFNVKSENKEALDSFLKIPVIDKTLKSNVNLIIKKNSGYILLGNYSENIVHNYNLFTSLLSQINDCHPQPCLL